MIGCDREVQLGFSTAYRELREQRLVFQHSQKQGKNTHTRDTNLNYADANEGLRTRGPEYIHMEGNFFKHAKIKEALTRFLSAGRP